MLNAPPVLSRPSCMRFCLLQTPYILVIHRFLYLVGTGNDDTSGYIGDCTSVPGPFRVWGLWDSPSVLQSSPPLSRVYRLLSHLPTAESPCGLGSSVR